MTTHQANWTPEDTVDQAGRPTADEPAPDAPTPAYEVSPGDPVRPAGQTEPAEKSAPDDREAPAEAITAEEQVTPAPETTATGAYLILGQSRRATNWDDLQESWQRIKAQFVDDPRASVTEAAALVEEAAETAVATIQERERTLRGSWEGNGTSSDTEKLRTALREYGDLYEKISQL
jgi:hypothetical protein